MLAVLGTVDLVFEDFVAEIAIAEAGFVAVLVVPESAEAGLGDSSVPGVAEAGFVGLAAVVVDLAIAGFELEFE